ncbi:hypothetical protein Q8A67_020220 [Cirrhinus molitorella]|uniref:Uncharacterized protein n=1 Tax=Cirrhinus molitorella TaxID=172907 RepID=A0AA88TDT4_9TELE|nr:hypothetical protein Q8A67_020220 [Cirrhinus molitorella]
MPRPGRVAGLDRQSAHLTPGRETEGMLGLGAEHLWRPSLSKCCLGTSRSGGGRGRKWLKRPDPWSRDLIRAGTRFPILQVNLNLHGCALRSSRRGVAHYRGKQERWSTRRGRAALEMKFLPLETCQISRASPRPVRTGAILHNELGPSPSCGGPSGCQAAAKQTFKGKRGKETKSSRLIRSSLSTGLIKAKRCEYLNRADGWKFNKLPETPLRQRFFILSWAWRRAAEM